MWTAPVTYQREISSGDGSAMEVHEGSEGSRVTPWLLAFGMGRGWGTSFASGVGEGTMWHEVLDVLILRSS